MLDIYIFVRTMRGELRDWMEEAMKADVLVTSSSAFANRDSIPVEGALAGRIAAIDGVDFVGRVRALQMDYAETKIVILCLDMERYLSVHRFHFVPGSPPDAADRLRRGEGVVLSQNLAILYPELAGAKSFPLRTPFGVREVPVVGVAVDYTSETGTVLMDFGQYRELFRDDLIDSVQVYLKPGASAETVRRKIYDLLGADFNLVVLTNREFKASILEAVDQMFGLAYSLEVIAMLIAFIGIVNNLMATVIDRTREIGVLRAIGTTRQQIGKIYVIQAGLLAVSGAVVSVAEGLALGSLHIGRLNRVFGGWTMPMHYQWRHIAAAVGAAVVIGIVAGFLPARRAAALRLHEALKYE
jgi:putative ABC transport system permease protein